MQMYLLLQSLLRLKKFRFTSSPEPDIQYVLSAAESIAPFLQKGNLIIIESTTS